MPRFLLFMILVSVLTVAALWVGGQSERRYENAACQYRMIYDYRPDLGMGVVTLGGSRMRVATNARHFNKVLALDSANEIYGKASTSRLEWDLSSPAEGGFRQWMRAYRELSLRSGTEVMFLVLTGTSESLPPPDFERAFEATFGMPMITMPEKLHEILARDGKRDGNHLNQPGREVFLP